MKKWEDGILEAREIAKKINRKDGGEMCAYIYDWGCGYIVLDECESDNCGEHIETWYREELVYSA